MWGADIDKKVYARVGIGLLAGLAAGAAPGQQTEQGAELFLDLRTGVVVSDNFSRQPNNLKSDDPATLSETTFELGYDVRRSNQEFQLRLGGTLEFGNGPRSVNIEQGLVDPFLSVGYALRSKTTELTFDSSVREQRNAFTTELDDSTNELVVSDAGSRRDSRYAIGLEFGQDAPVGASINLDYRFTDYFDTVNANLNDVQRYGVTGRLRMALSRTTDLSFNASYNRRESFDATETVETGRSFGIGLDTELNPSLSLSAQVSFATNEVVRTTGTTKSERPTFRLSLDQEMQNGTLSADLNRVLNQNGSLTTLSFSRDLSLRSGSLSASLGATWTNDERSFLIGDISWTRQWKSSTLQASLARSVRPVDDENDRVVTSAAVSFTQQLTRISDVSFSMNHTVVDNLDATAVDSTRTNATVTYSHRLTEDWSLNAGVSHFVLEPDNNVATSENRIFANIGRRFSFRP